MAEVARRNPQWDSVPYQVKRTSVRDACRAMTGAKKFNKQLAKAHTRGERLKEDLSELHFRSRKNPRQSCYIPDDAVTGHGIYHIVLGPLRMAEAGPAGQKECRLVKERGQYWLAVPYPAQCDIETVVKKVDFGRNDLENPPFAAPTVQDGSRPGIAPGNTELVPAQATPRTSARTTA